MTRPRTDGPLKIAARGSRLAQAQAATIAAALTEAHSGLEVEILAITTTGDRDQRPFAQIGGKGLFVTQVEAAVVAGDADVAVHSAKDLTAELADGCAILCVPRRADPRDVIVGGDGDSGEQRLGTLASGATIGTSSMRRRALLAEARPDLEVVELRGNLDTRLKKVADGSVGAAILAAAGIDRLGDAADFGPLDPAHWVSAPGQGALVVEGLAVRDDLRALLAPLGDDSATAEVACERSFAARLEGGCSVPLGCLARAEGSSLVATGYLGHPDGGHSVRDRISGPASDAVALGRELADAIRAAGGDDILGDIAELAAPDITAP